MVKRELNEPGFTIRRFLPSVKSQNDFPVQRFAKSTISLIRQRRKERRDFFSKTLYFFLATLLDRINLFKPQGY